MTPGWATLLILLAILAAPFVIERMRPAPSRDDATMRAAGGKIAKLPSGDTFYRWIGPARGPVAVLIHGISTPHQVWGEVAEGLGETAFRVLVYDLYGRGLSDAPMGRQVADYFVRQLEELLAHEGIDGDLTLAGYSMGGAVAAAFAAKHTDRMTRLILVAPAGIERDEAPLDAMMRQIPVAGDWLHGILGPMRARAAVAEPLAEVKRAQAARRGAAPGVLSSRRGILAAPSRETYARIGAEDVAVFAVWGGEDRVVPLRGLGTLAQWDRNAMQEVIDGAGHDLLLTHPREVTTALRAMLRD